MIAYFASKNHGIEKARKAASEGSIQKAKLSLGDYGFIVLTNDTEGDMIGIRTME